jgi:predicted dehydrogenase
LRRLDVPARTIGVVGCGYWGAKHIRSLHELGQVEIVACDLDPELLRRVQHKYRTVATTQSFEELLDSEVDGVIIATPMSTHFDLARRALFRGKDVLVEKPLTTSAPHGQELVELAEQVGAVLMVGHTFRYNPAVQAVAELVSSGELGEIHYVTSSRLNLGLFQHDANVLWDLAPHDLSILLYWLGEPPARISAHGSAHVNRRIHDNVHLDLTYRNGTTAHVHLSWLEPSKVRRATVVGTRKMVLYDDVSSSEKVWVFDRGVNLHHATDNFDDFHLSYRWGNTTILPTSSDEPLQLEQRHFLDCVRERRRPWSDGFAGLQVVQLLALAQRSLVQDGTPVDVETLIAAPPEAPLGSRHDPIRPIGATPPLVAVVAGGGS